MQLQVLLVTMFRDLQQEIREAFPMVLVLPALHLTGTSLTEVQTRGEQQKHAYYVAFALVLSVLPLNGTSLTEIQAHVERQAHI